MRRRRVVSVTERWRRTPGVAGRIRSSETRPPSNIQVPKRSEVIGPWTRALGFQFPLDTGPQARAASTWLKRNDAIGVFSEARARGGAFRGVRNPSRWERAKRAVAAFIRAW